MVEKIDQSELKELFGDFIPMEAVAILFNADGDKTISQVRAEIRELSKALKEPVSE